MLCGAAGSRWCFQGISIGVRGSWFVVGCCATTGHGQQITDIYESSSRTSPARLPGVALRNRLRANIDRPAGAVQELRDIRQRRIGGIQVRLGGLDIGFGLGLELQKLLNRLAPLARRIFLVPVSSERTAAPEELQRVCQEANPSADTIVCSSVTRALEKSIDEPFVLVTGSLYLVGEALENLEGTPGRALGERSLNEWSAKT